MRIWDLPPVKLCNKHLLGEHAELHAIWNILAHNKRGYSHHPETIRWAGKLKVLYSVHDNIAKEMLKRGFMHKSKLDFRFARGSSRQSQFVDSIQQQIRLLKHKKCGCRV